MSVSTRPPLILIGSSTGGPQVLEEIFSRVIGIRAAVIIVQHLSAHFVPLLSQHISHASAMPVVIPSDGDTLLGRTLYLAPSGRHLLLEENTRFWFSDSQKVNGVRPSIDITMESLVSQDRDILGILLTGMGVDGAQGLVHIHAIGGMTVVQDPLTCAIRSMPVAAIATGSVRAVLAPAAIADLISRFG